MKKIITTIITLVLALPNFAWTADDLPGPTQLNIIASRESTAINWINPEQADFEKVAVFSSTIPIEKYFSYQAVEGLCDLIYEGNGQNTIATDLAPNLPYYFIVFAIYTDNRYSPAIILERDANLTEEGKIIEAPVNVVQDEKETTNNSSTNTGENGLDRNGTLAGASANVVNEVSLEEAEIVYSYNQKIENPSNPDSSRLSLFIIVKSPNDLSDQDKNAISYFIDQGTPTTILLGAGERTGVLNSYLSVFNKLPTDILDWQDVIKIANGRWPNQRNMDAEEKAANETFSAIYQRPANMSSSFDSAAVTVIAYGLRPANRNMESEKNAIKIYEGIFKKSPVEAYEWDMVRAIAYSGATR